MVGEVRNVRVNNAYEPIASTHQPYGWDQMAALYRRYKVVGMKMRVRIINPYTTPGYFLARPVPVNENYSMVDNYFAETSEKPGTITRAIAAAGGPNEIVDVPIDIPKLLGITREQFLADTSRYSAQVTAAPDFAYVQIGYAGSGASAYVAVLVECEYLVQFWQRITQNQS